MTRYARWAGFIGAVLALALAVGAFAAANTSASGAEDALEGAASLYRARLDVAAAQGELGGSKIDDAIKSAGQANAAAERAALITEQIARLLRRMQAVGNSLGNATEDSLEASRATRVRTRLAARILATVAAYQGDSVEASRVNNRALARILRALRRTNESFPGGS